MDAYLRHRLLERRGLHLPGLGRARAGLRGVRAGGRPHPAVRPTEPRPLFHIAGVHDPTVRFGDQQIAMDVAKKVNGSTGRESSCGEGCTIYDGPVPVVAAIHSGGHVYPLGTSGRIAQFFRDHALQ